MVARVWSSFKDYTRCS